MSFSELLRRYAELLVVHGANIQPGQVVNISGEIYHRELLLLIAQECYNRGARTVMVDYAEPRLQRHKLDVVGPDGLTFVPPHVTTKYNHLVDDCGATIKIVGPEFPLILSDVDPKKVNEERKAFYQSVRRFYDEGIGKSKVHWTIGAAATPAWGKRVFPNLNEQDAEQALWKEIFSIARVDTSDFLKVWAEHNRALHSRSKKLTEMGIESLRFSGPGTDLTVGLSPRAIFKGGTDIGPRGASFEPNIPTEECFTTPDYRKTEGTVRATRPFLVNGKLIEGLELTFRGGEIADFTAKQGREVFAEYIASDLGAKRLGEVALVGIDSPVFKSGLVFEEILFDENAACHIAVGSAYKFCIKDGDTLTKEELDKIGCNESVVHTDMMISSEQVDVTATLRDGRSVAIIVKGEWNAELR